LTETDNELINKSLSGNVSAFDNLISRYQESVYKLCFTIGKNKDNAMDISQETFIKVFDKLYTFKGKSSFKSWLLKITYNEGINWIRKNKKYMEYVGFDEKSFLPSESYEDSKKEDIQISRSLNILNPKYRIAIVLRYYENMTIKEISESMNCSEGVVKNMLFRSLRKMKTNITSIIEN